MKSSLYPGRVEVWQRESPGVRDDVSETALRIASRLSDMELRFQREQQDAERHGTEKEQLEALRRRSQENMASLDQMQKCMLPGFAEPGLDRLGAALQGPVGGGGGGGGGCGDFGGGGGRGPMPEASGDARFGGDLPRNALPSGAGSAWPALGVHSALLPGADLLGAMPAAAPPFAAQMMAADVQPAHTQDAASQIERRRVSGSPSEPGHLPTDLSPSALPASVYDTHVNAPPSGFQEAGMDRPSSASPLLSQDERDELLRAVGRRVAERTVIQLQGHGPGESHDFGNMI